MPELHGEEQIDWNTFTVTDPDAPEYEGPAAGQEPDPLQDPPDDSDDDGDGVVDQQLAPEDTSPEASPQAEAEQPVGEEVVSGDPLLDQYLAKYGGDMEKAVKAAAHQDDLIGRQGQRIGDLEARLEAQLNEVLEAVNRPPAPSLSNLEEVFEEDPRNAAEQTLEYGQRTGDWSAHNAVMEQWKLIDSTSAGLYHDVKVLSAELARNSQRIEQRVDQLPDQLQAPQRYENALVSAESRFRQEFPDIDLRALQPAMIEEAQAAERAAGGENLYAKYMESGDPEQVYFGLRTLASAALNRTGAAQRALVAANARTAAVETQRAKADGMLTSSTATGAEPAPPKTYDDELLDKFIKQDERVDGFRIGNY